jgi:general secretion pathway protein L
MPTSAAEPAAGAILLVTLDAAGGVAGGRLVAGDSAPVDLPPDRLPRGPATLVVPGEQVSIHWLDLAAGLTTLQAAAAARLLLADASVDPIASMHVAVGRPEQGATPVALVPKAQVARWIDTATAAGLDVDHIVPSPFLMPVPATGLLRRERGGVADYRGPAAAYALEPELASRVVGDMPVAALDEDLHAAALGALAADPPLDLRQGAFAVRRRWAVDGAPGRRAMMLFAALAALTLMVQVGAILAYVFSADRIEAEAAALASSGGGPSGPGFSANVAALSEAVRATPNVEVTSLEQRSDGSLTAGLSLDGPATLTALRARLEASGLRVAAGAPANQSGRTIAQVRMSRP